MFPKEFLIVYFVASAIAIAWLLRRIRRKRLAAEGVSRKDAEKAQAQRHKIEQMAIQASSHDSRRKADATASSKKAASQTKADLSQPEPAKPHLDSVADVSKKTLSAVSATAQTPKPKRKHIVDIPPRASNMAKSNSRVSWNDRELFATCELSESDANPLPKLEPGDTPVVGTDDMVFGAATSALAELMPESPRRHEQTVRELLAAGFYQPHAALNFAAVRIAAILGAIVLFGTLMVVVPRTLEPLILVLLIGAPLVCWALPRLYIKGKAADRIKIIEKAMPDMLDMLNMCVSQGLTLVQSMQRIAIDLRLPYPDLATELAIVSEQADLSTLQQAMDNFDRRIDSPQVHSFTALVTQTDRMGTSVTEALTEYSDAMRVRLTQRAEEQGNRAAFRLLFPTVLCLMPAVYMFLLGPAFISLSDFFNEGGGYEMLQNSTQNVDTIPSYTPAGTQR